MKLTELQIYKIDEALAGLQSVLSQIKQRTLRGNDLSGMKTLENAVVDLEIFGIKVELCVN